MEDLRVDGFEGLASINSAKKRTAWNRNIHMEYGYFNMIRLDLSSWRPAGISPSLAVLSAKKCHLSLSQKIDRFWYGIPFRDKHIHVNWFFSRNERKYFVPLFPFLFFPFFFSLLFHDRINMPPVRLSRFDSPREKISARHPRHFVPSWRISCSFREIVEGTTLLHVVVTNPHPRRRSTATVFYYVLYRISRTRCSPHPSTKNRCQPGKRLTSATLVRLNDPTYITLHALFSSNSFDYSYLLIIIIIFNTWETIILLLPHLLFILKRNWIKTLDFSFSNFFKYF